LGVKDFGLQVDTTLCVGGKLPQNAAAIATLRGATLKRFPHDDLDELERLLAADTSSARLLDWLISISLLPLSYALTAPVAAVAGARDTLIGAGVVGAALTLGPFLLPGIRDVEDAPGVLLGVASSEPS
jgi:hypothetical protein